VCSCVLHNDITVMVVLLDQFTVWESGGLVNVLFVVVLVCVLFSEVVLVRSMYRLCLFIYHVSWCFVTDVILYYCCMFAFVVLNCLFVLPSFVRC